MLAAGILVGGQAKAGFTTADAARLETEVSAAVATFRSETGGADDLLDRAKGVLIPEDK